MKHCLNTPVCAAALFAFPLIAHADFSTSVYTAIEQYQWQESPSYTGAQTVKINGPQLRIGLTIATPLQAVPITLAGDASAYLGNLRYASQTPDVSNGDLIPYSSSAGIIGYNLHIDAIYTEMGDYLQPIFALGYEGWQRNIDSGTVNESVGAVSVASYSENWNMAYGKLGFRGRFHRLMWNAGMKLPFAVNDHNSYVAANLHPVGELSGYLGAQYALAQHWLVGLSYESTRFSSSAQINSPSLGIQVYQPQSNQDVYALSLHHAF